MAAQMPEETLRTDQMKRGANSSSVILRELTAHDSRGHGSPAKSALYGRLTQDPSFSEPEGITVCSALTPQFQSTCSVQTYLELLH